ncbi:MAG: response regulator [Novosphingobium sp.]
MQEAVVILIVEDEPIILHGMQDALEGGGYTTVLATNGDDALAMLDSRHHDLTGLITDIRIGSGPAGWDVARHARELKPDIAVVYVSGDSAEAWPSEGVPHSVMISKPFAEAQLVTAISNLITGTAA